MLNDDVCVLSSRNLGEKDKGCLQEIGFQEFVTVLSFFRPPKPRTADEEMKNIKKEKLRCENTDVSIAALFFFFLQISVLFEYHWSLFTFSRRFYPKRLTVHSGYTFFFVSTVHVFPWNRTHNLCAANAML